MTPVATALGWLPSRGGLWLGRRLGDLAWVLLGRRRRTALDNVRSAFPELSPQKGRRICRRSCQHLGMVFVELCSVLARPLPTLLGRFHVEGLEHLTGAMERYGRALFVTAHLGNWELLCAANHLTGYPLTVVVRPLDTPWLNALAERLRRKTGVELVAKRGALRPVLDALRRGRLVAILLDQNTARREGVFVPFFGRPASTSKSLAVLAIRTQTPVVPVFIRREAGGRHRIEVHPALPPPPANRGESAVVELTMQCTAAIEAAVRATPEQWLWLHDRWRTRPAEEAAR